MPNAVTVCDDRGCGIHVRMFATRIVNEIVFWTNVQNFNLSASWFFCASTLVLVDFIWHNSVLGVRFVHFVIVGPFRLQFLPVERACASWASFSIRD